jgi:hypothetical protein
MDWVVEFDSSLMMGMGYDAVRLFFQFRCVEFLFSMLEWSVLVLSCSLFCY